MALPGHSRRLAHCRIAAGRLHAWRRARSQQLGAQPPAAGSAAAGERPGDAMHSIPSSPARGGDPHLGALAPRSALTPAPRHVAAVPRRRQLRVCAGAGERSGLGLHLSRGERSAAVPPLRLLAPARLRLPLQAGGNGAAPAAPYKLLESISADLSAFPACNFFRVEVRGRGGARGCPGPLPWLPCRWCAACCGHPDLRAHRRARRR